MYKQIKFSNGSFTCYLRSDDHNVWKRFDQNCLSNNHILSTDGKISKRLAGVRKGDQIYLKGYLASYSHSNESFKRGSSITRTDRGNGDRGNGACETVYVTDFSILKRANSLWWFLSWLTKYVIISCLIFLVIVHFKSPVCYRG